MMGKNSIGSCYIFLVRKTSSPVPEVVLNMPLQDIRSIMETFDNLMLLHICHGDYFLFKVGHVLFLKISLEQIRVAQTVDSNCSVNIQP